MSYVLTHLEDFIRKLYHRAGIYAAGDIDDKSLAKVWGLTVLCAPLPSIYFDKTIIINNAVPFKREEFAHELCHATWHAGNQMYMPKTWLNYQEWSAENFAMHYCMPSFMLLQIDVSQYATFTAFVNDVANTYDVSPAFAEKRLQDFLHQLQWRGGGFSFAP